MTFRSIIPSGIQKITLKTTIGKNLHNLLLSYKAINYIT
jgi:hypothetical protein